MEKKLEKILILGKSGSGKDYLLRKLSEKGLKTCLKWTTRPARKFEQNGVNYKFVDNDLFLNTINESKFLTYQEFLVTPENSNETVKWYYGITIEEFNEAQAFIMTPGELKDLNDEMRKKCFIVYLDIDRSVRESRLFRRDDKNDSIKRRLDADDNDFNIEIDYDLRVTDPEFGVDDIFNLMN